MGHSLTVTFGSGILPHLGDYHPELSGLFQAGTYPQAPERDGTDLRRLGNVSPSVVLNPEDWSAHYGMAVTQVNVATSPLPLPASPREFRRAIAIQNLGPGTLYISDDPTVTTGTGYPLAPSTNKEIALDIKGTIKIYGVADSSCDVRILEVA